MRRSKYCICSLTMDDCGIRAPPAIAPLAGLSLCCRRKQTKQFTLSPGCFSGSCMHGRDTSNYAFRTLDFTCKNRLSSLVGKVASRYTYWILNMSYVEVEKCFGYACLSMEILGSTKIRALILPGEPHFEIILEWSLRRLQE